MSEAHTPAHAAAHTGPHAGLIDTGTERLIARKDGPIGWIIFNNPLRRNAVSLDMWAGVAAAANAYAADAEIRVVVLTGAGEQAFVSGADISQFEAERADPEANARYGRTSGAAHAALARLEVPLIAMIRGFCIGGGLGLALGCDLRIAAEGSRFAIPAARLGLGYEYPGIETLTSVVGPAFAREILFTARQFDSAEAAAMGLVNRVVPATELEDAVRALAEQIAANAPLTVRASKLAVAEAVKDPARRDLARVDAAVRACFASADYAEGRAAFMEKRRPHFQGR
jgi:enoyl-CoA hydratase/carnithine racemase